MKLAKKQIRILETAFSNYPKNFEDHRYGTMEGIQEQLDELGNKVGLIWYIESAKLEHNNQYYVIMGKFIANVK
jgi:hypothetical protein